MMVRRLCFPLILVVMILSLHSCKTTEENFIDTPSSKISSIARDKIHNNVVLLPEFLVPEPTREDQVNWYLGFLISPKLLITSTSSVKDGPFIVVSGWGEELKEGTPQILYTKQLDEQISYGHLTVAWPDAVEIDMARELPSPGTKIFIVGYDGYNEQVLPGSVVVVHEIDGESWIEVDIPTDEWDVGGPLVNLFGEVVGIVLSPPDERVRIGAMSTLVLSSIALTNRLGPILK